MQCLAHTGIQSDRCNEQVEASNYLIKYKLTGAYSEKSTVLQKIHVTINRQIHICT